jgi:hypothetical protein
MIGDRLSALALAHQRKAMFERRADIRPILDLFDDGFLRADFVRLAADHLFPRITWMARMVLVSASFIAPARLARQVWIAP